MVAGCCSWARSHFLRVCWNRSAFPQVVLAAALWHELTPRFRHGARHACCRPLGVRVNGVRQRLLHANVARENETRADAKAGRRPVHRAHEVLVRAEIARQRADLREVGHHVGREPGIEQRRRHRLFVDDFELTLVAGLLDAPANLVGDLVPELSVGALERRDEQTLLRELLLALRAEWIPRWMPYHGEESGDAQSTRHATKHPSPHPRPSLLKWQRRCAPAGCNPLKKR